MSKYSRLVQHLSNDIVHPLVADNDDWDQYLVPALEDIAMLVVNGAPQREPRVFMTLIRSVVERVYAMGYLRGRAEKSPPDAQE